MKKKLVVYLAGLLTVVSMGFGSAQFSDVPAGHWAKEAVEQIAACGLIQGFPDGTYRGRENLTRYQAALIFQRLLNELKEGGKCVAGMNKGGNTGDTYDHSDLEARLAALEDAMGSMDGGDTSDIEARLAALEAKAGMTTEVDTSDLEARIAALEDAQAAMEPPAGATEPFDASDLEARIAALEDAVAGMSVDGGEPAAMPDTSTLEARVATLEGALADVDNRLADVDGRSNDLAARVSILEDVLAGMEDKSMDGAAMGGEDMEVMRNAMQELAAELAALGVRTSALEDNAASKDDIARLEAALEEMKGGMMMEDKSGVDQAAMADLADRTEAASVAADTALAQAQILAERLDGIEGDVAAVKTQQEADADSIRALNELAVLLNQDVLSLQDRVTAVEKATADLGNINFDDYASKEDVSAVQEFATALRGDLVKLSDKVSALEGKVAALERNSFSISGSLTLQYLVKRSWGTDIDAATAGVQTATFDIDRIFRTNNFSSGDADEDGLNVDESDLGDRAEGDTTATLDVTFQTKKFGAVSDPGKLNSYPDLVQFSIKGRFVNADAASGEFATENNASSYFRIYVDAVTTTLDIAKGQALEFTFGRSPKAKFTEYIFDNDAASRGPGFIARFNLGPAQIWGVYGSTSTNGDNKYYRGARAAFGLGPINLGGSFVQEGVDQVPGNGTPGNTVTVFGVDAKAALGPLNVSGEFFNTDGAPNGQGFYVMASGDLGPIKVGASFRNIGTGIGTGGTTNYMVSSDAKDYFAYKGDNAAPFKRGQNGFGVTGAVSLGIIGLDAYFQNYTLANPDAPTNASDGAYSAFGITAKLTGLGPISLEGYFRNATKNGAAADSITDEKISDGGTYSTALGVKATLALGFANITAGFESRPAVVPVATSKLFVYGDAPLNFGIFTGKAIARFESNSPSGATTLKYGGELTASLAGLPLGPELKLFGVSRDSGSTKEGVYAAALKFNSFLFSNSTFEVGYGSYGGQNLTGIFLGDQQKALDPTSNNIYAAAGTNSGSVTGLYFTWTYWDLTFSYSDFDANQNGVLSHGQGFKIRYKVVF